MPRKASIVVVCSLMLMLSPAWAAPNLVAEVTAKGLLISSTGGGTGVCTVNVDISHLVDGVRVAQHVSIDGLVVPSHAQPLVLWRLPTLVDLRIESAVSVACS